MHDILPHANLAVSWGLLILIWMVQLIVYPSFHRIPPDGFAPYHKWYVKRISSIVLPLMFAELGLTVWWILWDNFSTGSILSAFMVFIIWLSTFALQIPIHNRLKTGRQDRLIRRLVMTNWIRTATWSFKAAVVSIDANHGVF